MLAGGLGRRIGGGKACVELQRRPLISYPLEAVWRALRSATIVAKIDTELPRLPGVPGRLPGLAAVEVWVEPQEPRHPLTGIVHALAMADGRPVLVCAADMPLVTPELIEAIAHADPGGAPAVVAAIGGGLEPLLGCYQPAALEPLSEANAGGDALRDVVAAIGAARYEVADPDELFNVNSPAELLQASAMLDRRRAGVRGSAARP